MTEPTNTMPDMLCMIAKTTGRQSWFTVDRHCIRNFISITDGKYVTLQQVEQAFCLDHNKFIAAVVSALKLHGDLHIEASITGVEVDAIALKIIWDFYLWTLGAPL